MDMSLDVALKILQALYYIVVIVEAASRARREYTRWRMTRRKK